MTADDLDAPCDHGSVAAVCPACLDAYVDEEATLAELEEPRAVNPDDAERAWDNAADRAEERAAERRGDYAGTREREQMADEAAGVWENNLNRQVDGRW